MWNIKYKDEKLKKKIVKFIKSSKTRDKTCNKFYFHLRKKWSPVSYNRKIWSKNLHDWDSLSFILTAEDPYPERIEVDNSK